MTALENPPDGNRNSRPGSTKGSHNMVSEITMNNLAQATHDERYNYILKTIIIISHLKYFTTSCLQFASHM